MPRSLVRTLAGETGEIRTAKYRGAEHLVVPVIALVEGVIVPANATDGPELALASEFGHAPAGWNGRPAMVGHPQSEGRFISANDPKVLESASIGSLFNTLVKDNQLRVEGWLNEAVARELGGDAESIVDRFHDGEQVEVSVGVFVDLEAKKGTHHGQSYEKVWRNVVPDHLAFLRADQVGACSIQMGCGAPRAAQARRTETAMDESMHRRFMTRVQSLLGFRPAITDGDLRGALEIALRDAETGFLGILAVDDGARVIYHAFASEGGVRMYQRSFKRKGDKIALQDDKFEVRSETKFVSVNTATDSPKAACGCGGAAQPQPASAVGDKAMDKAQRVKALIDSPKNLFTAAHQGFLDGCSEQQLTDLEALEAKAPAPAAAAATPAPAPAPAATPAAAATAPAPVTTPAPADPKAAAAPAKTDEERINELPEHLRTMVRRSMDADKKRKTDLVWKLKAAQKEYSEAELTVMSVDELDRISRLVNVDEPEVDYTGQAVPRAAAASDVYLNPPDPYAPKAAAAATK